MVMKQVLPKLKVKADWYSDVRRIIREQQAMQVSELLLPMNSVPRIIHSDVNDYTVVMTCTPDHSVNWKSQLMEGDFQSLVAKNAGKILRDLHLNSRMLEAEKRQLFMDLTYFEQLRIDPYYRYLINQYPYLKDDILQLIDQLKKEQICLVHGDFSPKNMLVTLELNVILLDYEVAHWGNPVFDVVFCTTHLMLKGWFLGQEEDSHLLIRSFLEEYGLDVNNLIQHLGLMLLARIDGKSTVEYLQDFQLKEQI